VTTEDDKMNGGYSKVVSHLWGKMKEAYPLGKEKRLIGSCKEPQEDTP